MRSKWFFFLIQITGILILFLWGSSSFTAKAESASSIRTEGSIGFYGTYESESKPQPDPPFGESPIPPNEDISNTGRGKLPQLGSVLSHNWIWIGLILTLILFLKRKSINLGVGVV